MKTTIAAIIFCAFFKLPVVFAADDSANTHLTHTLHIMFKLPYNESGLNESSYQQKTISYKGISVISFKCKQSGWTAFFKILNTEDLPADDLVKVKTAYKNATIEKLLMYFDNCGDVIYFAELKLYDNYFLLRIEPSEQIKVIS